jgi:hypothetical protein
MTYQNVLLNLVIGTIIDNLEFVTEELYVGEDNYWSQGVSIKQIEHHSQRNIWTTIWAPHTVVCGVSRTLCVICLSQIGVWMILDENVVVWGSMEWTIPKLIISTQLNIHTMDRVKEWEITETKSSSSFWYNVKRIGFPTF